MDAFTVRQDIRKFIVSEFLYGKEEPGLDTFASL